MSIRPLHDRVVVRRAPEETKTAGGLVLPSSATEKPTSGEVVAVGDGRVLNDGTKFPLDVKVGDTVVFGKYAGTELNQEEERDLLVIKEDDIIAVVE